MKILPENIKQIIIIATLFFTATATVNAQTDSLLQEIILTGNTEKKINLYIELSKQLPIEDTVKKIAYADSAVILSEKLNIIQQQITAKINKGEVLKEYKQFRKAQTNLLSALKLAKAIESTDLMADVYYHLGTFYYKTDSFTQSVNFHKKALSLSTTFNDSAKTLRSEMAVAVMLWRLGKLKDAEQHYIVGLEIAKKTKDSTAAANITNSLGAIYWGYGQFHLAFKYFNEAAKLAEKQKNYSKLSLIMSNIGLIYKEWGELDKAMEEFNEALKIAKKEDYTYAIAYAYVNIGEVYFNKQQYEKAKVYYDSALVNYKKAAKKIGVAYCYRNIGRTYLFTKNYPTAIKYYNLAVETAEKVDSRHHLAKALYGLAQTYFEMGNYTTAKQYCKKCLNISTTEYYTDINKDVYYLLSDIYEKENNPSKALFYYKKASALKDSIFNEKSSKQIAEMQAKYETEKTERENMLLKQDERLKNLELEANKNKIRLLYIFLIAFAAIIAIISILIFKLLKIRKELLKNKHLLIQQNERISSQKEELFVQSKNLSEINILLSERTKDLEQKKDELEKNFEKLEKATEFKNKMFSIIGHDLRGPLGTISSIITLALDQNLEEKKRSILLNSIKESAVSAYNLLENLLSWANNEQGKITYQPQNIELHKIILNSYNLLRETALKKKINMNINVDESYKVMADYNMLATILRNLISNAIKFSYEKGIVEISAKAKGDFIDVSICDYGIGMDNIELQKVLDKDRYFSSFGTMQEKGTGIGLQLCFEFIRTNKGIYHIETEKGKGTTITFSLPKTN